jgi:hypothetical protein
VIHAVFEQMGGRWQVSGKFVGNKDIQERA